VVGSAYAFEGLDQDPFAMPALAKRCCSTPEEFAAAIREGLAMPAADAEALARACQSFIEGCFSAKAQQQALRKLLPTGLLQAQDQQPVGVIKPWPEPLRGEKSGGVRLLASSRGLGHDGWLESDNQLVLELEAGARELRLGFYLPETGQIEGEAALELELELELIDGERTVLRARMALQRGENRAALAVPEGIHNLATLTTRSFYRYLPEGQADQRKLLAVLSELQAI